MMNEKTHASTATPTPPLSEARETREYVAATQAAREREQAVKTEAARVADEDSRAAATNQLREERRAEKLAQRAAHDVAIAQVQRDERRASFVRTEAVLHKLLQSATDRLDIKTARSISGSLGMARGSEAAYGRALEQGTPPSEPPCLDALAYSRDPAVTTSKQASAT